MLSHSREADSTRKKESALEPIEREKLGENLERQLKLSSKAEVSLTSQL